MRESSPTKASHVNDGTTIPQSKLGSTPQRGREFRFPNLKGTVESNDTTALGGLALAALLVKKLKVPQLINKGLSVLRAHRPYSEADHVLTHAFNLYLGGTAIEDIADLQQSDPLKRILGASRIPDPTTAGDFLRRLDEEDIRSLDGAIDEMHKNAWRRHSKKKQRVGRVDIDSHVHHVYGNQKEGADFTYKGGFGYHPLVFTLAETQECLRLINRPGNKTSADGTEDHLQDLVPLLKGRFKRVIVRGDSAFARQAIFDVCDENEMYFAMVSPEHQNYREIAESIPKSQWKPFRARDASSKRKGKHVKIRKRRKNLRSRAARDRNKRDLQLVKQWVAEVDYKPARSKKAYRLVIRRQQIEEYGNGSLFDLWRYRYVLSNLPKSYSAEEVTRETYRRCDQENIIEQLQSGVAAMRMPLGTLLANHAYLLCARIAHNLKAWLALLALPAESMRWEWKRFRKAFIYVAARVTTKGRQVFINLSAANRFSGELEAAIARLQN